MSLVFSNFALDLNLNPNYFMNEFLIYLSLPPYLAQWYANECTQIHNRDNAVCPREVYKFPTPVVPVRGSQESDVINMHLAKQPDAVPAKHGHWIMYAYDEAICSECNYDRGTPFETTKEAKEHWDELPMWCEGCGAKMDEEAGNG